MRLLLGAWVLCIFLFAVYFAIKNNRADVNGENTLPVSGEPAENQQQPSGTLVQGIPADAFAKHPDWTEDFLTPNEYSRPGESLESVKNIFVHYTANPGTSAAQNRSYFEWQKDTHEASVSSHFIIGYEGEIIQCVPLNEIAYAVMTRNYDSVSIECCYLAEDGSFTQETYDSLISLLAWLTDVYDLDAEDILRHYDCGGKKCPLYYTEHEDAWEQLKKDVDKL
ncbi:MAG: N-acetylmuramoyl-L-alanine amidase [Lachnospiraceae bacterium]|nr:N-acetylmuramoyl-L-alanine amidase [Lachnospiraceae bacterium]